jgi:hypothetical protein
MLFIVHVGRCICHLVFIDEIKIYYLHFYIFDAGGWKLRLINAGVLVGNVIYTKVEVVQTD